jgi:hypothetical protein
MIYFYKFNLFIGALSVWKITFINIKPYILYLQI